MYLIIIIILFLYYTSQKFESFTNYYINCDKSKDHQNLINIMENNHKLEGSIHWDLFIPCNNETKNIKLRNNQQIIFGLSNYLEFLDKEFVINNLKEIIPQTYLLPNNLIEFKNNFNSKKRYYIKTKTKKFISNNLELITKEPTIIQEILDNPYIINGKKINFDLYLLVSCYFDKYTAYYYNDININYTKLEYDNYSFNLDKVIPQLYDNINLKIYPKKLNNSCLNNKRFINDLKNILNFILQKFLICENNVYKENLCFQIFKLNFFISNDLTLKLLDINLPNKNELSTNFYLDVLDIIKIKPKKYNNFVQL